jgi:hypothetical protein
MPRNENSTDYHPVIARLMEEEETEEQLTYIDPDQENLFGAKPILPEADETQQKESLTLDDALTVVNSGVEIESAPKPQTNLFGDAEAWEEDWQGMPDFLQEDLRPARTLYVHFRTDDDVNDFLELIGQTITPKTQYIWFPYMKLASFGHLHWVADEEGGV